MIPVCFGLLMLNIVASICKSLTTRVTLERFLPCVNPDMSLQIPVCFGLLMLHIVASICKSLTTRVTLERFLPCVNPDMSLQIPYIVILAVLLAYNIKTLAIFLQKFPDYCQLKVLQVTYIYSLLFLYFDDVIIYSPIANGWQTHKALIYFLFIK